MSEAFKCPKCGATTWGYLKHCPNYGESLTIVCSECGYEWRYMYEYKSCGAKTSRPSHSSATKEGRAT